MKTRTEEFDEQTAYVTQIREGAYGHPLDNFLRCQAITEVVKSCPDEACRVALTMIGLKMARLVATPGHLDSWVDIAGYARTAVMALDEAERRASDGRDSSREAEDLRG